MLKYRLFPANERGHADYGWLKTYYSFSFADWYNPDKIHFGMLRVLNDDAIAPNSGFDFHPHNDMENVTIVLDGELTHQDSLGNKGTIRKNEVQVMSAGTGIFHAEKNLSNEWTRLFQIWIFPDNKGHSPRYEQKNFFDTHNQFVLLVSPDGRNDSLWIHQNSFISQGYFTNQQTFSYNLYDTSNAVYLMVIEGEIAIENQTLKHRDAIGIWNTPQINIHLKSDSKILLLEIPLH